VNILLADDHAFLRRGIQNAIHEDFPHATFGEASTAMDVKRQLQNGRWDLVILDIILPDKDEIDLLSDIRTLHPDLPVIMLSDCSEELFASRCIRSGASAYLSKESAPNELTIAIKAVLGDNYITTNSRNKNENSPGYLLSRRELQVLQFLAKGFSLKEISHSLSLSSKTVSTYRARLLIKLQLRSTAALIRYAIENRIVTSHCL